MKIPKSILILLSVALPILPVEGQNQTEVMHKKALEVLRRTMEADERRSQPLAPAGVDEPTRKDSALADMEQQYLNGKITAKQFQKYLQEHPGRPAPPAAPASVDTQARALELLRQTLANREITPSASLPSTEGLVAQPSSLPSGLSDIEAKMDELQRLKAARDKAAQDKTIPSPNPSVPKTKRQRLDELLKVHIQGQLSEAEYKEKRAKIIAEPD